MANYKKIEVELKDSGFTKSGMTRIAFCFDYLDASQLAYSCIYNVNEWLKNHFGTDFCIFYQEQTFPCIVPNCARYFIEDISNYYGNIICSTVDNVIRTKNCVMSNVFFYIQDIYEKRNFNKKHKDFVDIMNNKSIVKFARSKEIRDHYRNLGFEILEDVVEDYDIQKILEIVNGKKRQKDNREATLRIRL